MHYNLLYYGVNNSFCNTTNNNLQKKNSALREIISYAQPDIFTVNEISSNATYHTMILDSVLNIGGITHYERATITNFSGTTIINGMFYNSEKLGIVNQYALVGGDRDINVYKMYYKSPDLSWSTDTVFLTVIVAHLASGSGVEEEENRDNEVTLLMNHIASLPNPGNFLFQGDFNLYTDDEPAFQRLINNTNANIRFYDPINKIGTWNNNSTYAAYHTQSTHTAEDCFISGGLDDRFDFIMASLPIIMETYNVKYVPSSYVTLGQDGQHFNKSLIESPTNSSAPADVIQALYDMSDHLPVMLSLKINQTPAGIGEAVAPGLTVLVENPISNDIQLNVYAGANQQVLIRLFDCTGRLVQTQHRTVELGQNDIRLSANELQSGLYILNVSGGSKYNSSFKLIKY